MHLDGKEFEELLLWRSREIDLQYYTLSRYGVMAALINKVWTPIRSLPDFEGVLTTGQQFIFDAKTCTQPSFDLPPPNVTGKSFTGQYRHLRKRAAYNVLTFLLIHFNERQLKTKIDSELTVLMPVYANDFWRAYDAGAQKSITRNEAKLYGIPVEWDIPEGRQKISPNLYKALLAYRTKLTGA